MIFKLFAFLCDMTVLMTARISLDTKYLKVTANSKSSEIGFKKRVASLVNVGF